MKIAFITPVPMLEKYATQSNYHLILAQVCAKSPEYVEFYRERRRAGDYVILDNGAYELGAGVDVQLLKKYADIIQPSAVVLPDVRNDALSTIALTRQAIEVLRQPNRELFAVPQAPLETEPGALDAWFASLRTLQSNPAISAIGIYPETSRFFPTMGGRARLLWLMERGAYVQPGRSYHLLGMNPNPVEIQECAKYPWVIGADSAKPIVYGLYGIVLHSKCGAIAPYPHRPPYYFEMETDLFPDIVQRNIRTVMEWSKWNSSSLEESLGSQRPVNEPSVTDAL